MKIGMVGLGKLGLPVALTMEKHGHTVYGYDPHLTTLKDYNKFRNEKYVHKLLDETKIEKCSIGHVVKESEIIFVAVQTPHDPQFGGENVLPKARKNFDYSYLRSALIKINREVTNLGERRIVVVISTVLPGTMHSLMHLLHPTLIGLVYNPSFIAMGTVFEDFQDPEFILMGHTGTTPGDVEILSSFYDGITGGYYDDPTVGEDYKKPAPKYVTTIENAELIKVSYNTFIGLKIMFANTLMEICHKIPGCDVDSVSKGLFLANKRLISTKYMLGGMGDAGACHPRDNIAMSWLADDLGLRHDIFENVMKTRDVQTAWLTDLIVEQHRKTGLPIIILGMGYKANTHLYDGSCALLLSNMLVGRGYEHVIYDPLTHYLGAECNVVKRPSNQYVNISTDQPLPQAVYFHATNHDCFKDLKFPTGSVVLDPWRSLDVNAERVTYIPIGVGK